MKSCKHTKFNLYYNGYHNAKKKESLKALGSAYEAKSAINGE